MGTRDSRTSLGREAARAGGLGEGADQQARCPECGKVCCAAALNKRQVQKSMDAGLRVRCPATVCHRAAGWGTNHSGFGRCKFHFGSSPSNVRAAARQEARTLMRTYGIPVEIDPEEALREEIHRTVGHVRWLAEKVATLSDEDVINEGPIVNGSRSPRAAKVIDIAPTKGPNGRDAENDDYREDVTEDIKRLTPTGDDVLVYGVTERQVQAGGEGGGFDRVTVTAAPNIWLQVYMAERRHLADITKIAMAAGLESRRLDWAESMADRLIGAMEELATQLGHDTNDPRVRMLTADALTRLTAQAS